MTPGERPWLSPGPPPWARRLRWWERLAMVAALFALDLDPRKDTR